MMKTVVMMLIVLGACAPTLSSFQPAHIPPKGSLQAEVGSDLCLPLGTYRKVVDAAETIANAVESSQMGPQDQRKLAEAGVALLLNPIATNTHAGISYAFAHRWDGSLRLTTGGMRLGARHQLLEQALDGMDLTVGLGVGRATQSIPRPSALEKVLEIHDPTRWSLDGTLAFGKHGDFYRFWVGPRALLTTYSTSMTLRLPQENSSEITLLGVAADGHAFYLGGQIGLGVGYRWLFLAFETTLVRAWSRMDIQITGQEIFQPKLNDWVIYPGIGLLGEF